MLLVVRGDAVRGEDVAKHDDAFELVDIGAIDDGKHVQAMRAHALERGAERMIGVKMGKVRAAEQVAQRALVWTGGSSLL